MSEPMDMNDRTRDYRETIKARMARDPEFADAMLELLEDTMDEVDRLERENTDLLAALETNNRSTTK